MTTRQERGEVITKSENQIKRIDETTYVVKSQSSDREYQVVKNNDGWICECPDHKFRHVTCKHIHAVLFSQSLRAEVSISRVIPELNVKNYQYCGSDNIVKDGKRHNKYMVTYKS